MLSDSSRRQDSACERRRKGPSRVRAWAKSALDDSVNADDSNIFVAGGIEVGEASRSDQVGSTFGNAWDGG